MKKSSKRKLEVGAGVTAAALLAAAAGAYFLSGKEGKKRKAKMKSWAVKARKEVARQAKMARRLSEMEYKRIVDRAVKKYGRLDSMSAADMMRAAQDLRSEWAHVKKHAKMMAKRMMPKKRPAKKAKRSARKKRV